MFNLAARAISALFILILILIPASGPAWALDRSNFKFGLENYFALQNRNYATSVVNPDNTVLRIPDLGASADLRPEMQITTARTHWVARPRWVLSSYLLSQFSPL